MPNWTKVRANIEPYKKSGFVYLDQETLVSDGPWLDVTTYSANISSYLFPVRYKKDADGFVTVSGRWVCSGSTSSPNLFQLPVGYRPTYGQGGLNVGQGAVGECFLANGNRSAGTLPGLSGLTNTYEIAQSVCRLTVGYDGWVRFWGYVWGEYNLVGFNNDAGFNVSGQWRKWDDEPWSNLFGRITNLRFPTT